MRLTECKRKADANAAEVESARELAEQMKELEVHPLLKWNCARSVRDAYFCGIVFAAVSDEDNVVDDVEQKVIDRIGRSLALSEDEIGDIVKTVTELVKTAISEGGGDVFALLEESSTALREKNVFQLFVAEDVKVCGAKEVVGTDDVRTQLTSYACAPAGADLDLRFYKALCRCLMPSNEVKGEDLVVLSEFLGDEVLRYLMLDSMGDVFCQRVWPHSFVMRESKVKNSHAYSAIVWYKTDDGYALPFGFFDCCFTNVRYDQLSYAMGLTVSTQIGMHEQEFDAKFGLESFCKN